MRAIGSGGRLAVRRVWSPMVGAALAVAVLSSGAPAQMPPPHQATGGATRPLPPAPEIPPHPSEALAEFVEGLKMHDSMFEVIVRQGRILSLERDLAVEGLPAPTIAVGDPSVIDVQPVGPRQLRVIGQRIGQTDLSVITARGEQFVFDVHVVPDLSLLRLQLAAQFPDARLKLTPVRQHIVVSGQARNTAQVQAILQTIEGYLAALLMDQSVRLRGQTQALPDEPLPPLPPLGQALPDELLPPRAAALEVEAQLLQGRVINLLHVPGPQQVLLKVQIAELNRTALRELGANLFYDDLARGGKLFVTNLIDPTQATVAGVKLFHGGQTTFEYAINALRRNEVLKILAEPNLVALNGHEASFLAGGEFPVPVPQIAAGVIGQITIQFREFGVRLRFVPHVIDRDTIRLTVSPEVSSIDETLGVAFGGFQIPALSTRAATTVVEMPEGQTFAMAGLLQVEMNASTTRIPGLGDLPILGPFFSNNTSERIEKELVVLVTPYLVEAAHHDEFPPLPGAEVDEPTDLEFYLLGRLESRTLLGHRPTTRSYTPARPVRGALAEGTPLAESPPSRPELLIRLEQRYIQGPCGFSP